MPATSKTQFRLFSQVYGVQKYKKTGGKEGLDPQDLDPDYRKQITNLADEMKQKDVKDMIDVDYQKLPDEVKEASSDELEIGTKVEMEHTDSKEEAEKIAKDHLSEDPNYYSKLYKAGLIDEPEAIELAKKAFENNAMATPGSVNGMGSVALPGAPGTDETGSGDIAATSTLTDDDEENDDDGKKIYKFLKFNAFVGESVHINEAKVPTKKDIANAVKKWKSFANANAIRNMQKVDFRVATKPLELSASIIGAEKYQSEVILIGVYDSRGQKSAQYSSVGYDGVIGLFASNLSDKEYDNIINTYGTDLLDPSKLDKSAIVKAAGWMQDYLDRKLDEFINNPTDKENTILNDLTKAFGKSAASINVSSKGNITLKFHQNIKTGRFTNTEEILYVVNPTDGTVGVYSVSDDYVRNPQPYRDINDLIKILKSNIADWKRINKERSQASQLRTW